MLGLQALSGSCHAGHDANNAWNPTLYELLAALQTMGEPDEDALLVAIVALWVRTGRLTLLRLRNEPQERGTQPSNRPYRARPWRPDRLRHPSPQRTSTRRSAPLSTSERVIDRGRTAT